MKVIVVEVEKDVLKKCLQAFNLTDQITFLDGLKVPDDDPKYGTSFDYEPYYIEENINDLDKIIATYDDEVNIPKKLGCSDMGGFYELLLNIKKQRDIGCYVDDMEYIYKMGLRLNLPIEYRHASELDDRYSKGDDFYVITGQSDLGKMELLHRFAYDFILIFSPNKTKKFSEMEFNEYTHWHPYTYIEALNDMIALMTNDKKYFKNNRLSVLDD